MPKRIPIAAASRLAKQYGCRQMILLAWDGELTHVVTFGTTPEDCTQAAAGGNKMKVAMGWPESLCNAQPARAKAGRKITDADIKAWSERHELHLFGADARAALEDAQSLHLTDPEPE